MKLLLLFTEYGTNQTKQMIWEITPTSIRVQIASLFQFFQKQLKKKDISIQDLPSSFLIDLVTKNDYIINGYQSQFNLTPFEIVQLFIQILALLDFFHRHTTRNEDHFNNQRQISPYLEIRLYRILKDENEICLQLDEVVQAIGDILMKEKERNVGEEYNLIQRINYNLKDTLTSPYNFTLVLRAKNSLFLLTAIINEQQIQFKPEIIEVDLVVFFKSLVSKSRVYSQSSTTSELIWRFCIDSFCKAMHNPGGNASSFVHNSKLMQVLSLWMCNAGGEEQNDAKIIETMEKLIWFNFNYPQHKKYGKNDLDGLFEQKERDLLVTENFEEQMIEEGAKEDCEANIFSQKSNIKQKSIQLKTELMGLNWH
ncbi:MAG: hypothetical protein EZS28_019861 [Streblomastix strix]|uniref:Uncharacterized protein n=1 Tax=Streblomastix strix TaxID=222440 RepID=A0A5J4VQP9_9EUKA|nr:MAG: hypothetical protein EZS28_019861 [Streblomastix strix]